MAGAQLSCREIVELADDHLEGALAEDARRASRSTSAWCPLCVTHLDQIRATVAATRRLSEGEIDPAARDGLVRAFRSWAALG